MNIYMQSCGLAIMAILLVFFLKQRRIDLFTERIFFITLIVAIVSVSCDAISVVAIHYMDKIPRLLLSVLCKNYLVSLVWVGCMGLMYAVSDLIYKKKTHTHYGRIAMVLVVIESVIIYALPIYFHDDVDGIYTYGSSVVMTYVFTLSFVVIAFVMIFKYSKNMHVHREYAYLAWIALWLIAAIIQFAHNELLLVGFSCSLGMMILFIALENPESNIDRKFGCFNSNTMNKYLKECYGNNKSVAMLLVSMTNTSNVSFDPEMIDESLFQLVRFLQKMKHAKVFKNPEQEIIAIFPDMSEMTKAYQAIQDEFYADQYYDDAPKEQRKDVHQFPKTLFVLLPDSLIASKKEDIYALFQHIKMENRESSESQVCYVNQSLIEQLQKKTEVRHEILNALKEDRVEVFFQPIYSVKEKAFVSAEALVRIRNTDGTLLSPGQFIPVAEETGLISKLGERVFRKTCQFLHESGVTELGIHYVEVNLSVVQCEERSLANRYIKIMEEYKTSPWMINLEITETASVQTKKLLLENMKKLIDYGVSFSLDDFGNGQSNLDYVIDMPVSIMKLDMNMTQSYFESLKAQYVMRAAIGMAHEMDLFLVAEGVETKEQLDTMESLGIDYVQGYFFAKPLPQEEFVSFIRAHYTGAAANRE